MFFLHIGMVNERINYYFSAVFPFELTGLNSDQISMNIRIWKVFDKLNSNDHLEFVFSGVCGSRILWNFSFDHGTNVLFYGSSAMYAKKLELI
jgi:hypothetical protein